VHWILTVPIHRPTPANWILEATKAALSDALDITDDSIEQSIELTGAQSNVSESNSARTDGSQTDQHRSLSQQPNGSHSLNIGVPPRSFERDRFVRSGAPSPVDMEFAERRRKEGEGGAAEKWDNVGKCQ